MTAINGNIGFVDHSQMTQRIQEGFKAADIDESGSVSRDELLSATEQVKKPSVLEKMFERADADGNDEVSEQEHQAMIDEMSERMKNMRSGAGGAPASTDSFMTLLESLESSEEDLEVSNSVREMREKIQRNSLDRNAISHSMAQINNMYPRIDTTV